MARRTTYLQHWRKFRGYTQAQVLDRLEAFDDELIPRTAASLSRIETGKQIYGQRILEALADIYRCDPADLLGRNPFAEGDVVDLVAMLSPADRQRAVAMIGALNKAAEDHPEWRGPDDETGRLRPRKAN